PPCDLYPETFAARALESVDRIHCEVWDEARLTAERMGAILGVARGAARPPRLLIMRYSNAGTSPVLALVGKGVTVDSGGVVLRTKEQKADMKGDMAGGAAGLGPGPGPGRAQQAGNPPRHLPPRRDRAGRPA